MCINAFLKPVCVNGSAFHIYFLSQLFMIIQQKNWLFSGGSILARRARRDCSKFNQKETFGRTFFIEFNAVQLDTLDSEDLSTSANSRIVAQWYSEILRKW